MSHSSIRLLGRVSGLFCALALVCVLPAAAAYSNDPLTFVAIDHHDAVPVDYLTWCGDCVLTDYHDGAPWVVNPGTNWPYQIPPFPPGPLQSGCMWDTDDFYIYQSSGNVLAAGATASVDECRYYGLGHAPALLTDIVFSSPSPNLLVRESWTWDQGGTPVTVTATVVPVFDAANHNWRYFDCIASPPASVNGNTGSVVEVPGSNGGQVVPQLVALSVTNPTSQKVTKTGGIFESGIQAGGSRGCQVWRAP